MALYSVTIPIAGHVVLEVEASSEEEAIDKGMEEAATEHINEWDCLKQFNSGNVCHCPSPWKAEAELQDDEDEGEAV
jgi:hypothetical protein